MINEDSGDFPSRSCIRSGFINDLDTDFQGCIQLGTGGFSGNQIAGVPADGADDFSSGRLYQGLGLTPGQIGKGSR